MSALKTFKDRLEGIAKRVQTELGVSADIGMGQAAHESNSGISALSDPNSRLEIRRGPTNDAPVTRIGAANNLFGFTAEPTTYWRSATHRDGNQEFVLMDTREWLDPNKVPKSAVLTGRKDAKTGKVEVKVKRPFRAYPSWEASYRDWARLMGTTAYRNAGAWDALQKNDADAFGTAMNRVGYATHPGYGGYVAQRIEALRNIA